MSPSTLNYQKRRSDMTNKLIITLLLFSTTTLVTLNNENNGLVQSSSASYIYDHILPTAKVALNKIRGSLSGPSPSASVPQLQQDEVTTTTAESRPGEPSAATEQKQDEQEQRAPVPPDWMRQAPVGLPAEEPKKDEFVNLEVRGGPGAESAAPTTSTSATGQGATTFDVSPGQQRQQKEQRQSQSDDEQQATVVSTSESVSEDPTTAFSVSQSNNSDPADSIAATDSAGGSSSQPTETRSSLPVQTGDHNEPAAKVDEFQSTTTTTTTTTTATATTELPASVQPPLASEPNELAVIETNQIGDGSEVKSAAEIEAIRATELEAVAAVDASMGFGDSFANPESTDACYDEYGNARYCEPEFENVALERQVDTSSECGHPASRFCTTYLNEHNDQIRNCHICDAQHPKKRHPSSYLTDMNNANSPTCWVSAPISAQQVAAAGSSTSDAGDNNSSISEQDTASRPIARDNVTLTLNFDKKFEITYISMQFCSLKPDSLAIWRSADFGQSWSPYQFYSSQCERMYERPIASATSARQQEAAANFEASCMNTTGPGWSVAAGRIAFSTLDAIRASNSNGQVDKTGPLQAWMTATNIRVVLDRHQANWIQSSLAHHPHHRTSRLAQQAATHHNSGGGEASSKMTTNGQPNSSGGDQQQQQQLETSLTNPSDTYNYALSDLTVGGRCKCNGHASRCVHSAAGKLQCDCQHNTDGHDCERCLPLHHDRPWQPATQANANPCQPCNCNGHSRKCRFDAELYLLSGKRSGGVCIDCKDNTTGRHCHWCKEGHTRDHSKPMSDKGACKPCDCHPVGSVGKVCNQTTGQCPCKEGVTGLECNRCAPGYQQSSSPSEPCIKLPENDINYEPFIELDNEQVVNSVVSHQSSGDQEPALLVPADQVEPAAPQPATSTRTPPIESTFKKVDQDDLASPYKDDETPATRTPALHRHQQQPQRHYQWRQHQQQFGDKSRANGGTTFYRPRNRQHQQFADSGDYLDEMTKDLPMSPPMLHSQLDEDPEDYQMNPRHQLYTTPTFYQPDKRQPSYSSGFVQNPRGRPAIASLDPGDDNYEQGGERAMGPYGQQEPPLGAIYPLANNNVDDDFNDIQTPAGNLPPNHRRRQQHTNLLRNHNGARVRHPNRQLDSSLMPVVDNNQPAVQQASMRRVVNSLTCADCQSAIKKMSFKQFCHLEYAIRAIVFDKQVDTDWTRFDVEIKDIFKSPTSSSSLQVATASQDSKILTSAKRSALAAKSMAIAWESGYLADEPIGNLIAQNQNQTQRMANEQANSPQVVGGAEQQQHPIHRLKIGSVQSIWIPTEDVTCKCPRLKLGTSYLLMGLVDTKENSATSIQLDRHGVALEWKASLQEKLIRYQKRHARGRC